jgi:hypothetical protein
MVEKDDSLSKLSEALSTLIKTDISTGISTPMSSDAAYLFDKYSTVGIGSSTYSIPKEIYEMEPYIKPISRIPFLIDLYLSGNYTPVTKSGDIVVITYYDNDDTESIYPISGFIQGGKPGSKPGEGDTWTKEGYLFNKSTPDEDLTPSLREARKTLGDSYDLMLIPKPFSFVDEKPSVVEKPALVEYKLSPEIKEKYYVITVEKKNPRSDKPEPIISNHSYSLKEALEYVNSRDTPTDFVIVNAIDIPGLREMMIDQGHLITK